MTEDLVPDGFVTGNESSREFDHRFREVHTSDELMELASLGASVRFLSLTFSPEVFPKIQGLEGLLWHRADKAIELPPLEQLLLVNPQLERLPTLQEPGMLSNLRIEQADKMEIDLSLFRGLRRLSISGASHSGDIALPPSEELEHLELTNCGLECLNLSFATLQALGDEPVFPASLTYLNLACNRLEDLPAWMTTLKRLESLNLEDNRFPSLPNLFELLPSLRELHCSGNPMSRGRLPEILMPPVVAKEVASSHLTGHIGFLAQSDRLVLQGTKESKNLVYEFKGQENTWTVDWLTQRPQQAWQDVPLSERYKVWRLDETRAVFFAETSVSQVFLCDLERKHARLLFLPQGSEPEYHLLEPGIAVIFDSKTCVLLGADGQVTKSAISDGKIACSGNRVYRLSSNGELTAYSHKNSKLAKAEGFEKAKFSLEDPRWYEERPAHIVVTDLVVTPDNPHIWGKFDGNLLAVWEKDSGTCLFAGSA